jgi:hypothetical protein
MLTVMGGLLTSIGHEIMSRLSILRSANRVQTAWHSLKQNPLLLQDSDFVVRMEGNLKRLVAAKDGLIRVVNSLLASVRQTRAETVDVLYCLDAAIQAIAKESDRQGIIIVELMTRLLQ